ncbi:alpha/beta fold hydrolase [Candidatus Vallotia cooleyia]|uniref:alpha/beta fold hydrolase n=1 Tax=Candidatus Vallotiella adelgis TaxID=1177211 RepID=UPI001D007DBD|nr:alpha/beta hydrolase [Candidatus Vallotia cooleyia]UDG82625.1 alpha/beta hydrolase [Candidatus Vallotia cooleyia]
MTRTLPIPREAPTNTIFCAQSVTLNDDSSIAFSQMGMGEPIVLVHGSLCDYRYWGPQFVPLAATHRVLSLSLGHYFPTRELNCMLPFSWNTHVWQIAEFIDNVVCEPAHIIAHSRGAYLAFHLALRFPDCLRSITLADPGGAAQRRDVLASVQKEIGLINALHSRSVALIEQGELDYGLALFIDSVSSAGSWAKSPKSFKTMARDNAHTLRQQISEQMPDFSAHEAKQITLPVLLIGGEKSPSIFHRNIAWLHKNIDDARQITIAGASHGMNLANPYAFNRAVLEFINYKN